MTTQFDIYNYINNQQQININEIVNNFDEEYIQDIINILNIEFNYDIDITDKELKVTRNDYKFKKNVKSRYNNKCIITEYDIKRCEIAHIKPFSECLENEKYDPDNGLLLDSMHKLYDQYEFTIHPETFQIMVKNTENDFLGLNKYNNKILNINKTCSKYLKYHYDIFMKN